MKNLFNSISQEEKSRILEMLSGKKNVISEQVPQPSPQPVLQNNPFLKCFTDQGIPENMVPASCKTPDFSAYENVRPGLCSSEMITSELYKKPEYQDKIDIATTNHLNLMINKMKQMRTK